MKIIIALLGLAPFAAFGFVPNPLLRTPPRRTRFALRETIASVKESPKAAEKDNKQYCIPLEDIKLDDLPKVGG
jgi:hypothetical protein